jgi:hypothetical protein
VPPSRALGFLVPRFSCCDVTSHFHLHSSHIVDFTVPGSSVCQLHHQCFECYRRVAQNVSHALQYCWHCAALNSTRASITLITGSALSASCVCCRHLNVRCAHQHCCLECCIAFSCMLYMHHRNETCDHSDLKTTLHITLLC